jgi:hypothetical protein
MNQNILQHSLQVTGGDPFEQNSGVVQQLDKNYSYGMFGPGSEQFPN